jgi:D-alanyl-D-alanine carboxypeptidase
MKTKLPLTIICFLIALAGSFAVLWFFNHENAAAPETANQPADNVQPEPETEPAPEPVAVRLPNADPIYDVKPEYFAEDGIWALVNKKIPLKNQNYSPADLVHTSVPEQKSGAEMTVREIVKPAVEVKAAAAKTDGIDLMIASAFRSYQLQTTIYNNNVKSLGQKEADRQSAKAGASEHQLGLAIDFTTPAQTCRLLECFENTAAGKWLAAHAHEYGFILRYTKTGEAITGYMYEPWHFRFVGAALSTALHQNGALTFEEAYPYLEQALTQLNQTP